MHFPSLSHIHSFLKAHFDKCLVISGRQLSLSRAIDFFLLFHSAHLFPGCGDFCSEQFPNNFLGKFDDFKIGDFITFWFFLKDWKCLRPDNSPILNFPSKLWNEKRNINYNFLLLLVYAHCTRWKGSQKQWDHS